MKIFIWIVWIFGAGILHIFGNNSGTAVILTASVALPPISLIIAAITSNRANIVLSLPERHTKGEEMYGDVEFCGGGLFSCAIVCENCFNGEIAKRQIKFDGSSKKNNKIEFSIETTHCGIIRISVVDLRVFDMFGLFSIKTKKSAEQTVLIPPLTFDVDVEIEENIDAVSDNGEYSVTKSGTDNSEIYAVREYVPGDPIKNIHWKMSGKTDRLMVREFGTPAESKVLIVFRKSVLTTASELDSMAENLFSLSLKLSKEGIRHDIVGRGNGIGDIKKYSLDGETTIEQFCTEILSEPPYTGGDDEEDEYRREGEYSHTIIVSPLTLIFADCKI